MNNKKLIIILINVFLIVVQFIIIEYAKTISNVDNAIILISWLSIISFVVQLLSWKKISNELLSPFGMFLITLYAFTLGQTIGWTIGIDLGTADWWKRTDHGMNHQLIFNGVIYSIKAFSFFFLGALLGEQITKKQTKKETKDHSSVLKSFEKTGRIFLSISIPAFILQTYYSLSTVKISGYAGLYAEQIGSTTIQSIVSILANFYQPSLLLLLISNKEKKTNRRIILLFMIIDVIIDLFVGRRSGAVMAVIGIVLSYHYFIKPIKKKNMIFGAFGGYVGIAVLNCVSLIRNIPNKNITTIIDNLIFSFSNVLGTFIGELGWNLSSICWTMNLVPSQFQFRYGKSYITALLSWIPSFVFGGKYNHPSVIYSNVGDWLQRTLNMSYGPGYTMTAESYINFGSFGIIVMLVIGYIVARLIAKFKRENANENIFSSTFQIIFVMTIMKSLIRSSFSAAFRIFFFNVLPLYIVIKYLLNKKYSK